MANFDIHSLEIVEYPKILSILQGRCVTPFGIENIERMMPSTDIESIRQRMDEISEMKDIIRFGIAFPLYRIENAVASIQRAQTDGAIIATTEMMIVKEQIDVALNLHNYDPEKRENFPLITEYLIDLHPFPDIKKALEKSINYDGEVLDSASGKLKNIRRDITSSKAAIKNRLSNILASRKKSPGWQDDTVIMRDGRYLIPAIAGQFKQQSGIIHDRSQSGATLFVEPNEIIESNNKLGTLHRDEKLEIERILRALTAMIGINADKLLANCELIGILDALHAAADFAIKTDSDKPTVVPESRVNLIQARHPLLMYYVKDKKSIVANDFDLNENRKTLIITGPNTGGKTVALKTVGLLILMAQTGLHIPADHHSEIGIFDNVYADIGDEQSIELSLSTFSSHIRRIITALKNAGKKTFILFDEIGAGTDPKEGSALAEAIILHLLEVGCITIVTTHYSQLKTLPMIHPEIENASFEFDKVSLQPTYRLHTGIPGASYAVEIAERLGLPKSVAERAAKLVGQSERSLSNLIESLESELITLRKDKAELEERIERTSQLEEIYKERNKEFKSDIQGKKENKLIELENNLKKARKTIEQIVKEIREDKASEESVKKAHNFLKETESKIVRLKQKHIPSSKKVIERYELQIGDRVHVKSFNKDGELIELIGNNKGKVRIGNMMTTAPLTEIKKIASSISTGFAKNVNVKAYDEPNPEIHLRGMTVDEATEALDKFIDRAILSNLSQIYVVHGHGTGALRKALGAYLKKHSSVESLRLGNWNEGGGGITIVKLK